MEGTVTDVTALVAMADEATETSREADKQAERDRDYYDNKQWTADEARKVKNRGQAPIVFNAIQRKIDYLSGLERQTRRDPKAFPRTPGDDGAAQAATDALRYVCDDADWDQVRSAAWDNLVVEGRCAVFVGAKDARQGVDPDLIHLRWDRFFADPHSAKLNYEDAQYMGFYTWDDLENAKALFPGKEAVLDSTFASVSSDDTQDDKPRHKLWADPKRKRVRYAEIYYRQGGKWMRCIFTKSGHLTDPEPSPYHDEDGQPDNPIKAVCLRRDRENNTYGDVRIMIGPQDDLNKRHSKALHLITMRQSRVSRGAGVDPDEVKRELAKPDGSITADKDEFEILPTNDMAAANLNMMQISKAFIDGLGANAALAGKNEQDQSGRAILAQQQGGMIELARAMDRLRVLSLSVYRAIWARIRQYWKEERWIRVTDDERNLKFVGLNKPVTVAELAQQIAQGDEQAMKTAQKALPPQILQLVEPAMQGNEQAQAMLMQFVQIHGEQVVQVDNQVGELDVDIVIDEGIDTPTVQAEQFDTLTKIMPNIVNLPPPLVKMLIQASSLRDKDKMLEEMEKTQQGPQIPPELQQQIQEGMQQMQAMAKEIETLKAQVGDKAAEQQLEQMRIATEAQASEREAGQRDQELEVDAYRAHTERAEAMMPEQPREAA